MGVAAYFRKFEFSCNMLIKVIGASLRFDRVSPYQFMTAVVVGRATLCGAAILAALDSQFAYARQQTVDFLRCGVAGAASANKSVRSQAQSFDQGHGVEIAVRKENSAFG
jgi:hypothetical protein